MRQRLTTLLAKFRHLLLEYGAVALIVHYVIFAIVIFGFWTGIRMGWKPSDALASVGTWTAAYVATKLTQPVRIVLTLALTPFVARAYERVTRRRRGTRADDSPRSGHALSDPDAVRRKGSAG